jgi:hypothetical protein
MPFPTSPLALSLAIANNRQRFLQITPLLLPLASERSSALVSCCWLPSGFGVSGCGFSLLFVLKVWDDVTVACRETLNCRVSRLGSRRGRFVGGVGGRMTINLKFSGAGGVDGYLV